MKYAIVMVAVAVVVGILIYGGYSQQSTAQDDKIVIDLTNPNPDIPVYDDIRPLFGFDNDIWRARNLEILTITDVDYSKTYNLHLKKVHPWLGKKTVRLFEIRKFEDSIRSILEGLTADTSGRNYSSIFHVVIRELNRLSNSDAESRSLMYFGDLFENSDLLDYYKKDKYGDYEILSQDSIVKILESQLHIENLEGIKVHLIYTPQDQNENVRYRNISNAYKEILEVRNADVTIAGNLSFE